MKKPVRARIRRAYVDEGIYFLLIQPAAGVNISTLLHSIKRNYTANYKEMVAVNGRVTSPALPHANPNAVRIPRLRDYACQTYLGYNKNG